MICIDYHCRKYIDERCTVYPTAGVALRERFGYCPVLNDGPNAPKPKVREDKKRLGQQKQKKHK